MAIPFNQNLLWENYCSNPDWHKNPSLPSIDSTSQTRRALNDLFVQTLPQPITRGVQFLRDTARLVLKEPIRSIATPIILKKNWAQRERATINAKLAGYSFLQLISVPCKFLLALTALAVSLISRSGAKYLLDKSACWTARLDGRASQLEALKEVGCKKIKDKASYEAYKRWVYSIEPRLCS